MTIFLLALFLVIVMSLVMFEGLLRRWSGAPVFSISRRRGRFAEHSDEQHSLLGNIHAVRKRDPLFSDVLEADIKNWISEKRRYRDELTHSQKTGMDAGELKALVNARTFLGTEFSIRDGFRGTTNSPINGTNTIWCFGGSTTFCLEVRDSSTWCSVLQERLMKGSDSIHYPKVENRGRPGALLVERIKTYTQLESVKAGDVAVFLFGDNDSGWTQSNGKSAHDLLPVHIRLTHRLSHWSEICAWLYGEISPEHLRRLARTFAKSVASSIKEASAFSQIRGVRALFVLQPNVFTLSQESSELVNIRNSVARDLPIMLNEAYSEYQRLVVQGANVVSAANIFNDDRNLAYVDWAHYSTRGNLILGEWIFQELLMRRYVDA